ncbi:MAG: protein kinase, partial [Candidatus Eremiobacterota bacterium]
LATLHHISLPVVIDYFIYNDHHYLIMDYIEGEDLENLIIYKGIPGLPQYQVIKWGIQICEVLEYLHNRKLPVIYRDLKPSNIMLETESNRLILIDFGIACVNQEDKGCPRTRIGTMGYMAPEQYMGKPVPQSDLYALGATLYHLLTGSMPVPFTYKPVSTIIEDISEDSPLEALIRRSLNLEIEQRFQTAKDMRLALLDIINCQAVSHDSAPSDEKLKAELQIAREHIITLENKLKKVFSCTPFPGNFSSYNPLRLLRFLFDSRATGEIIFYSELVKGKLYIKNGEIKHVIYNNWEGEPALAKFLTLKEECFDFHSNGEIINHTITCDTCDLLELIGNNNTEHFVKLEEIVDTLISPDMSINIDREILKKKLNIKLTKYQMKLLGLISQDIDTINKLAKTLNSSQLKPAESIYYFIKSGLPVSLAGQAISDGLQREW